MVEFMLWCAIIFTGGCGVLLVGLKTWWWIVDKVDDWNWRNYGGRDDV